MRTEKDFLGEVQIPKNALYGINSVRAKNNFPNTIPFPKEWYKAIGLTKKACYLAYSKYTKALKSKDLSNLPIRIIKPEIIDALIDSANEITQEKHFEHFIVPVIQGGAGTSINMNINEIISNRALEILNSEHGNYSLVDPFEDANIYQSTNDVIPTALKLSVMNLLLELENKINELRKQIEKLESEHRNDLRISYTQMQAAVPSSWGLLFSAYNEALSRDWWRVSKSLERIKTVNIGGGAIGTGISIPRYFIMEVAEILKEISKLPITRSEIMVDATSNLDSFVEIHAILKSHAVNLEKISSDMRLLASDISKQTVELPKKQTGSSIMPGKINPVICEYAISVAHKIYANDNLISSLAGLGVLELNAYLPSIGAAIIESIELLISANKSLGKNLFNDLKIDVRKSAEELYNSPSIATSLSPFIGYHKAAELANFMKNKKISIQKANLQLKLISQEKLDFLLLSENLLKQGFSIKDIIN